MSGDAPVSLRERTRRAVQAELTEIAEDLFLVDGYERTTVDEIAAAAGMAKRSFFRYFAGKEDLVVGKYEAVGDRLVEALADRPLDEPVWTSLRRSFDFIVASNADERGRDRAQEMSRIVRTTPALRAAYLEKFDRMQTLLVDLLRERDLRHGVTRGPEDPTVRAIVGAAFACLQAAQDAVLASAGSTSFEDALETAMGTLHPGIHLGT